MTTDKCNWGGHEFSILGVEFDWPVVGGLYIFAKPQSPDPWHALYIGQTESFRERLPNHPYWPEAVQLGATHIHAKMVPEEGQRDAIESYLIETYQPL